MKFKIHQPSQFGTSFLEGVGVTYCENGGGSGIAGAAGKAPGTGGNPDDWNVGSLGCRLPFDEATATKTKYTIMAAASSVNIVVTLVAYWSISSLVQVFMQVSRLLLHLVRAAMFSVLIFTQ